MNDDTLYPWTTALSRALARDRAQLPHGLLLAGPRGLGKNGFACWLAEWLLCAAPADDHRACGRCQGCQLLAAGSHPDLHVVQPESVYKSTPGLLARYALRYPPEDKGKDSKDSTVIRIDQVRALIAASHTRPQIAGSKVLILSPADTLNTNAANSLLKLLEEPPPDSHLVLVADRPARLPATIRSRCARVEFRLPGADAATGWLQSQGLADADAGRLLALAGGAPLAARQLAESGFLAQRETLIADLEGLVAGRGDPLTCAGRWREIGVERCLHWLQGWLGDLVRVATPGNPGPLHNPDVAARLQALEKRLDSKALFLFSDAVGRARQLLGGGLDEQLIIEDTLIRWTELRAA